MVAAGDTFINEMLKINGLENIYDNNPKYEGRYPEVVINKMRIQGDPDFVLSSNHFLLQMNTLSS